MGRKGVEGAEGGRGEEGMERRREGVEVRSKGGWQEERREGRSGGRIEGRNEVQSDGRSEGRSQLKSDVRSDVRVELQSHDSGYHSEGERREEYRLEDFSLLTTIGTGHHSGILPGVKNHRRKRS